MLEGYLPPVWRQAEVNPPRSITSDLRPISLTPVMSKCMEAFVVRWLLDTIGAKLDPCQYGNIKGRSTTLALIRMMHDWATASDQNRAMVRVLLVDFGKAFDLIDHNILVTKLETLQVPAALVRWIHAFLSDRRQRVRLQDDVSEWLSVNGGVPQRTKLGPILFLVMINDLRFDVPTVKYVDDTTVYECIPKNGSSCLQSEADALSQWCDSNGAKINTRKTVELRIDFSKLPRETSPVNIYSNDISTVSSTKLLGVVVSNDLSWSQNTDAICKKASQRLHYLVHLRRAGLDSKQLVALYCSFVRPILEYCMCVWHFALTKTSSSSLERVQERALHIIFGFDKSYDECLEKSAIVSLKERRESRCRKLFCDMQRSDHVLHDLLPPLRQPSHSLRSFRAREPGLCHTDRCSKSFVHACLRYFQ